MVYGRLEEVFILVVLGLHLHSSLLLVLAEPRLLLVAQPLVELDGLYVDLFVLELGVLDPRDGRGAEKHAEVRPQFGVGNDEIDELVVVLGLFDQALQGFNLGLKVLPLVLLFPEVVHESSDHIFGDILLIALDLSSIPADLASEEDQLLVLVALGTVCGLFVLVVLDGVREMRGRKMRMIGDEQIVAKGDCVVRELYLEYFGDEVVNGLGWIID